MQSRERTHQRRTRRRWKSTNPIVILDQQERDPVQHLTKRRPRCVADKLKTRTRVSRASTNAPRSRAALTAA